MTSQALPVGATVDTGWNTFKESAGLAIGVTLVVCLVPAVLEFIYDLTAGDDGGGPPLLWLAQTVAEVTLELGAANVFLKLRDKAPVEFADVFNIFPRVPVFFVSLIITAAAFILGLILLIIPGIIVLVRLKFTPFLVLDEKIGPINAVQRSWELTRGFTFDLFLYDLLLLGINLLGFLAFFVGLFASLPVTGIALADMYRFLKDLERQRGAAEVAQV